MDGPPSCRAIGYLAAALIGGACDGSSTGPTDGPIPVQTDRLALTSQRSCLVERSGEVVCWGVDPPGRATVGGASLHFIALRGGYSHLCGISVDSTAYCWGSNLYGELGDGTQTRRDSPTRVATSVKFVAITASVYSTCALEPTGRAHCWGRNDYGAIGINSSSEGDVRHMPTPVLSDVRFLALDGAWPNCGISTQGQVFCWGAVSGSFDPEMFRAPGDCTTTYYRWYLGRQCLIPTKVASDLEFITLGGDRCALTAVGEAFCWGDGSYGALGNANGPRYSIPPVQVKGGLRFRVIANGATHVCALDLAGKAFCWGNNFVGQLGIGENGSPLRDSFRTEPTPVLISERFVALAAGSAHTCGLTNDEAIYCWGTNASGQLGPGGPQGFSNVPIRVQLP